MANVMNIIFDANKLEMQRLGGNVYEAILFDFQDIPGLPQECAAFSSIAAIEAAFAGYVERARATGMSLKVTYRQHGRCPGRKFPGFKAAQAKAPVNVNPAFEDGTPYVETEAA